MSEATLETTESSAVDPESTRERILDVAEALFAERGLAGTAVRDIAREAGLTAPSLYNHFDGKQALYEAVLARGVQPLFAIIPATGAQAEDRSLEERHVASEQTLDSILAHLAHHPRTLRDGAALPGALWCRPARAGADRTAEALPAPLRAGHARAERRRDGGLIRQVQPVRRFSSSSIARGQSLPKIREKRWGWVIDRSSVWRSRSRAST